MRRQWRLQPPWPSSTGHLEQKAAEMRAMLVNRKAMFRDRDRTTLLLTLIALRLNRADGVALRHDRINRSPRLH